MVFIGANMFITNEAFRSPLSALLGEVGEVCWDATELALHQPWFLVTFRQIELCDDEEFEVRRTMLLSKLSDVDQLVRNGAGEKFFFDSVQVITPGHVNGTEDWKMDSLHAVWSAQEPDMGDQTVEVYETASGFKYVNCRLKTSIDELQLKTLKFQHPAKNGTPQSMTGFPS